MERQIPNIHIMDLDVSNHMVLLDEAKSYETIYEFSEALYSEDGISKESLEDFKEKTLEVHGRRACDEKTVES